jgi:hypothetical protein
MLLALLLDVWNLARPEAERKELIAFSSLLTAPPLLDISGLIEILRGRSYGGSDEEKKT